MRELTIDSMRIVVLEGVYEPSDDTFLLLDNMVVLPGSRVLELCSGTGVASVKAALMGAAEVVAVDICPRAAVNTRINAELNSVGSVVHVICCDLGSALRLGACFDVVLCNPPYLPVLDEELRPYSIAWSGGPDGRAVLDRVLDLLPVVLREGGRAFIVQSSLSDVGKTMRALNALGLKPLVKARVHKFFEDIVLIEAVMQREVDEGTRGASRA